MNLERFDLVTGNYSLLRVAIIGDFCLDRYLEIDPARTETSIETGLDVLNVVNVRSQPGAAGTILNNLVALGVGEIYPVGFCGEDGEGYELRRAMAALPGVQMDHFGRTHDRHTFTYCKPLVLEEGKPPRELNRLDSKNWSATPEKVEHRIIASLRALAHHMSAFIIMDQVDVEGTGVVTRNVLEAVRELSAHTNAWIIADSRRSLSEFPPVTLKMNAAEFAKMTGANADASIPELQEAAAQLAASRERGVFVTLAERGIIGASWNGEVEHVPAFPLRGEIDVVGAGDAVTANLTAALARGASLQEAMELAMAAASTVIHQLGTTGTATIDQLGELVVA